MANVEPAYEITRHGPVYHSGSVMSELDRLLSRVDLGSPATSDTAALAELNAYLGLSGRRKPIEELSPAYRQRVISGARRGLSRSEARGHGATPERPEIAERRPEQYREYRRGRLPMSVFTVEEGVIVIAGLRKPDRSKVGKHWNAINAYLTMGETKYLRKFDGKFVGGYSNVPRYELETRTDAIDDAAMRDEMPFEQIYQETA